MWTLQVIMVIGLSILTTRGLDNGLARTPPMGWLSWERFRCITDCVDDPDNCISERLFKTMADYLVKKGYSGVGYNYVIIDDCWPAKSRDPHGRLQADAVRFPNGIKPLADYIHSKGLKFGIYEDFGSKTCGGYPGSEFFLQMDANTFAEWGVDYVKLDGCNAATEQMDIGYPVMGFWLNQTGRPMLYSCSWPAYQEAHPDKINYTHIAQTCNVWRNYNDIQDSWDSVLGIINFYGDNKGSFREVAAPGQFNDPDMIIVGNFGLSYDQQRVQMALWAIMAAPLIMSNDLRKMRPESKDLLLNKNVIAIDQDPLGIQGQRIEKLGNIQIWARPVMPKGSLAFCILNTGDAGTASKVELNLASLGLVANLNYTITEVFDGVHIGRYQGNGKFKCRVNPTGVVFMKAVPQGASQRTLI